MSREEKVAAVEEYLRGLANRDLSKVPFAADVTFESPLTSMVTGRDAVVGFLTGLFPAIRGIQVKQHIVEGDYVATVFDFETTFGVIPVFDRFRVAEGQLKEIHPFYDPRPITESR
ncbi:MAG: nuclear transport factor 2 family protein, partial [Bryobacteraceae bacterium]